MNIKYRILQNYKIVNHSLFKFCYKREKTIGWPPLIISGSSGAGKVIIWIIVQTTLKEHLLKTFPNKFEINISYTTRKQQNKERHGHDYFFIETETFENDVKANKFLEYSSKDYDFYGTRRDTVTHIVNSGKICLLEMDTKSLKMALGNGLKVAYRIFISPPNFESLRERLKIKYQNSNDDHINKMIIEATKEIELANHLNLYHYIIQNRDKEVFVSNTSNLIRKLYPFVDENSNNNLNRRI